MYSVSISLSKSPQLAQPQINLKKLFLKQDEKAVFDLNSDLFE
jgi:hypothetical protein